MKRYKQIIAAALSLFLILSMAGCGSREEETEPVPDSEPVPDTGSVPSTDPAEKNGEVYILYTSDVHCGIDQGFGYAGLWQIKESLQEQGYEVLLVDDGDAIQGEPVGSLTKGEKIIGLMNSLGYDAAIPGNHEFDYTVENFLSLTEKADFPYISCNFNCKGELLFEPYVIKEAAGMKIAFVGVTTPSTITSSTPKYFQDESGNFVYDFLNDETGEKIYTAVQEAVDAARSEGADLVYVMGHLGMSRDESSVTYADVIENTNGIDVFLDGHSHDTQQVVMKNKDGEDVTRSACGTKLNCIGYSLISSDKTVIDTGIWSWPNGDSMPQLLNIHNKVSEEVDAALTEVNELLSTVVTVSSVDVTIYDPVEVDQSGNPIRMVRRAETSMGDLCADAYRTVAEAEIALVNGGGVRKSISKGEVTYEDIISVNPFGNSVSVIRASGQQILDALEWGAHAVPGEFGGFLQTSGLTYEIDASVESTCEEDENGFFLGVSGERRVRNVMVGDQPIDPEGYYLVAGGNYTLLNNGDGATAFNGAEVVAESEGLDYEVLIKYITEYLDGDLAELYGDPYGDGRIKITE